MKEIDFKTYDDKAKIIKQKRQQRQKLFGEILKDEVALKKKRTKLENLDNELLKLINPNPSPCGDGLANDSTLDFADR